MTVTSRLNRRHSDADRATWDKQVETISVLQRGVFDIAMLAMKSLLVFNGGSIIALLTFFGNLIARNPSEAPASRIWAIRSSPTSSVHRSPC